MKRRSLILSYVTLILSSVFALLALGRSGTQLQADEMLRMFVFLSLPNVPSLVAATIAMVRSRRSAELWLAANLIVAVPICAIWFLLAFFSVEKSEQGPVHGILPGDGPLTILLHVVLASLAFVVVAIGDLAMANESKNS